MLGSLVIVLALQVSPVIALGLVAMIAAAAVVVRLGMMGVGLLLVGALPWLVVLGHSGAAADRDVHRRRRPWSFFSRWRLRAPTAPGTCRRLYLGMALFYAPVVVGLARAPRSAQFIEAAKYFVFPFTVLARHRRAPIGARWRG